MLESLGEWEFPLREASALAVRPTAAGAGAAEIVAVDDEGYQLARALIAGDLLEIQPDPDNVTEVMKAARLHSPSGSDFEGVACDVSRRVFVLQEGASRIVVFNADLTQVVHTISMVVGADEPGFGPEWRDDSNSRGEGLLLLRNGHVLIAKQKKQPRLIEFGPAGEEAGGFEPGSALPAGEQFSLPAPDVDFVALASWPVAIGIPLESINDLAVDEWGRLLVVSSLSRRVGRLNGKLDSHGGAATFELWELHPDIFDEDGDRAEGLVWVPEWGWFVALDLQRHAPNLVRIGDIPA